MEKKATLAELLAQSPIPEHLKEEMERLKQRKSNGKTPREETSDTDEEVQFNARPNRTRNAQTEAAAMNVEEITRQIAASLLNAITENQEPTGSRRKPAFRFGGKPHEEPEQFIEKARTYFRKRNVHDDDDKLAIIGEQLIGEAKAWFDRLQDVQITWQTFKEKFRNKYNSVEATTEARRQLYNEFQTANEDTEIFITKKWGLLQRLEPGLNTEARIHIITDRLRPEICYGVQNVTYHEVEDFIQAAVKTERNAKRWLASTVAKPVPATAAPRREYRTTTYAEAPRPRTTNEDIGRTIGPRRPPTPCRHCGAWHYNNDCPTLRRRQYTNQGNERRQYPDQGNERRQHPDQGNERSGGLQEARRPEGRHEA